MPRPAPDEPRGYDDVQLAAPPPPAIPHGRHGLDAADREKLSDALRELLECKRILERAREG
jgi:hypothetical protein